eukprot:jgi/Phyca11/15428/fgenesh1_pg.PHYCAscaffold_13_\
MSALKDPGKAKPPDPKPPVLGQDRETQSEMTEISEQRNESEAPSQDSIVDETQHSSDESDNDMQEPDPEESRSAFGDIPGVDPADAGESKSVGIHPDAGDDTQQPTKAVPSSGKVETPLRDSSSPTPAVQPFEMFEAVVVEMQCFPQEQTRNSWTTTIGELFSIAHAKVSVDTDLIPSGKQRYPKLKGDEKVLLCKLFKELCVFGNGTFEEWERYAQAATQDLYNTSWSFKTIMHRMISKVKWAKTKPLNQWAAKVKAGSRSTRAEEGPTEEVTYYQDFMFNPSVYSKADIAALRRICEQPAAATAGSLLRPATKDEWKIIGGLVEGTIVCRRMPDFLKSVFDSQERLRFHRTIQSQVEGELQIQLRGRTTIRHSRQQTQMIQEDIRIAAEELRANTPELRKMLSLIKTISYNHAQRSVHFFFFDRATARQFEQVLVPFRKVVYRLTNVHQPDSGSIWDRQLGRDGTRLTQKHIRTVSFRDLVAAWLSNPNLDEVKEFATKRLEIQKEEQKLYAHAATLQQKLQVDRSRYDVLAGDDEEDDETAPELPGPASPPSAPIEIQTEDELEEKAPVQLTEADKAKLHLVKAKPPKGYAK